VAFDPVLSGLATHILDVRQIALRVIVPSRSTACAEIGIVDTEAHATE
jgi:hypothetical protein